MPKYENEKQIKDALKIKDFKDLTNDKIIEFIKMIPCMDKDAALAAINQIPSFFNYADAMLAQLNSLCDEALKSNKDSQNEVLLAYKQVLIACENSFRDIDLSYEQRVAIINEMAEIADKMAAKDTENKAFIKDIVKNCATVIGGALVLGFSLFGLGKIVIK